MDASLQSFELLNFSEDNDTLYFWTRTVTKPNVIFRSRENMMVTAFRKLSEGVYMEVFQSVNHPDYPETKNCTRIDVLRGACIYFLREDDSVAWNCLDYRLVNPRINGSGIMNLQPMMKKQYLGMYRRIFKVSNE
jgi:hypothetical protein